MNGPTVCCADVQYKSTILDTLDFVYTFRYIKDISMNAYGGIFF